jgi:accessory Sec system S-layer assembly protein
MWSLLKKKKQPESLERQTENQISEEEPGSALKETLAQTTLFIHPAVVVSQQEKYVFQYYHQLLPALQPNQVSISGYDLLVYNESVLIDGFISHSLPSSIRFEEIMLLVIDSNQRVLARKAYDFTSIGELPPNSSMPWKFFFEPEDIQISLSDWPEGDWKLAFEIKKQNPAQETLELEPSWEDRLSESEKQNLRKLVTTLTPLKKEEVNLFGLKAEAIDDSKIALTLLIRNGSSKTLQLSQIPLQLAYKTGEVIASGVFQLGQLSVGPSSCKPWTFIFPEPLIDDIPAVLKDWVVSVPQKK